VPGPPSSTQDRAAQAVPWSIRGRAARAAVLSILVQAAQALPWIRDPMQSTGP
jgi:hypothetical protein